MIVTKTAGEDEKILNYARKEIENCGCKEMQEILKVVQWPTRKRENLLAILEFAGKQLK